MKETSRNRLRKAVPILIVVVALVPVVLALLVFRHPSWFAFGHGNHGRLVQPAAAIEVPALPRVFSNTPLSDGYFQGEWTMVIVGSPYCDATCRETLYVTRQIRLGMGRDIRRVQRLYVVRGDHLEGAQRLRLAHPDLTVVTASGQAGVDFVRQFTSTSEGAAIYLVDPRGRLMMTYSSEAKPLGLIKDLRHLLKTNTP
ncbi:MAG: hypothetical protein L0I62_02560 [Gammaproteobacteria bacterium]|nr:hypothetical protein [Gammaproteobacteria bacterium]